MAIDFDGIRNRYPLVDIAARYVDLKKQGREYVGICPFHRDSNPSLRIYRGRDGVQRYRCFACGAGSDGGDVIDFVASIENIDVAEAVRRIDGGEMPMPDTRVPREIPPDESDCWEPIVPVPADAMPYDPARTWNPKRGAWVRYRPALQVEYRRPDGGLVGHIVRLEFADGEKICPVITYCVGPSGERRWCAKRPKPPYPLVGCEELARKPDLAVLLVEGEKKRKVAAEHLDKFVVVSLLGGAEAVKVNDLTPLKNRTVYLWPDADAPGRRAMRQVGEALS